VGIRRSRTNYKKKKKKEKGKTNKTNGMHRMRRTEDFRGYLREDPKASEDARVDEGEVQAAADGVK
jgi:hypothetical protein